MFGRITSSCCVQMSAVTLSKDIFRSDFMVAPVPKLHSFRTNMMKWGRDYHINQIIDTVNAWSDALPRDNASWSLSAVAMAREFWEKLSADAIKGVGFLYGLDPSKSKRVIVDDLVEIMAMPVRPDYVKDTILRFQAVQAGQADPGPSSLPPIPGQVADQEEDQGASGAGGGSRSDPSHQSAREERKQLPPGDGQAPTLAISSAQLEAILAKIGGRSKRKRRKDDDDSSSDSESDSSDGRRKGKTYESFIRARDSAIARRRFFDPTIMGEAYQEIMVLEDCGLKA